MRVVSVGRLTQYLKTLLAADPHLADLAVQGEVSNLRRSSAGGGALYFTLKDDAAMLSCVAWPSTLARLPEIREGRQVIVVGGIGLYPARGTYQLVVRQIRLAGIGDLFAALEELRIRLQAEGLFAIERKRPLPRYPFRVALVSSSAAQGALDFRSVVARRSPHVAIHHCETAVQGEAAIDQIVAAIAQAGRLSVDLIAVVRGGGAPEDLLAFSAEAVVRAIAAAPLPVVTGIGHESDSSLADFVADHRAMTPTDAAGSLPAVADIRETISGLRRHLEHAVTQRTMRSRQRFSALHARLLAVSPASRLAERRRRLQTCIVRCDRSVERLLERRRAAFAACGERLVRGITARSDLARHRLALATARLDGRNPEAILGLGYAIVRRAGRVVRDTRELRSGDLLEARLAYGTVAARVESVAQHE